MRFSLISVVLVEKAGGECHPFIVDVRSEEQVKSAVEAAAEKLGGIDILINNASAIQLTGTAETSMKRYDLMYNINSRGTFMWCVLKSCNHNVTVWLSHSVPVSLHTLKVLRFNNFVLSCILRMFQLKVLSSVLKKRKQSSYSEYQSTIESFEEDQLVF